MLQGKKKEFPGIKKKRIRRKKPSLYPFSPPPFRPSLFPSPSPSSTSRVTLLIFFVCTEAIRTVPRPPRARWDGCHAPCSSLLSLPEVACNPSSHTSLALPPARLSRVCVRPPARPCKPDDSLVQLRRASRKRTPSASW
jgi:hypothetical protein